MICQPLWVQPTVLLSSFAESKALGCKTTKHRGLINGRSKMFPCALSALDRLGCWWPHCGQVLTVKQLLLLLLPGLLGYKSINNLACCHHFFHCLCYCRELHKCAILGRIHEQQSEDVVWDARSAICRCTSAAFESSSLPYMPCKNSFQADVYTLPLGWLGFWEDQIWSNCAAGADNANPQKISEVNYLHRVTGITRQGRVSQLIRNQSCVD